MKKLTKSTLKKTYIQTNKSGLQVARELGISRTTLSRYLDKFGIKRKTTSEVMTGRKLSPAHRAKVIKTLNHGKGKYNPAWKGGKTKTNEGYIWVKKLDHPYKNSNGYVLEHRLVIEKKLSRYLTPSECVHHINGIKDDNKLENLRIVTQQEHAKIHWGTKEAKKKQSEFMKKTRAKRFWSTKKIV